MSELLPIAGGLSLGVSFACLRWQGQGHSRILATVLLGLVSCALNGELQGSWAFLVVDVLLVAAAATMGYALATRTLWLSMEGPGSRTGISIPKRDKR